jgi:copper transport protein
VSVRLALVALLAVLGVGLAAAPASAHAELVSTDPADGAVLTEPPDAVTLTFSEAVTVAPDGIAVYDAAGDPVGMTSSDQEGEAVTADLPEDLADGTYVVAWRVVSDDGHPEDGELTFSVGAPSPAVVTPEAVDASTASDSGLKPVVAVVQAVDYVGLLLAGGLIVFRLWMCRGVVLTEPVARRLRRLLVASATAAVAAAALAVPLSGAYQLGLGLDGVLDGASWDLDLVGNPITVLILQAAGLTVAVAGRPPSGESILADLGTALAVWSPAVVGHTRAYDPSALLVVVDAVHLSGGAVWLGGLAGLLVVLRSLADRSRDAALVLARFSTLGASALVAIAVAGSVLAWRIVGGWGPLVEETYGRLLLVKVAVVAVVVAVAAWNRYRLAPRAAMYAVRRAVAVETVLLVAVLGITAVFTGEPPRGACADGRGGATVLVDGNGPCAER